jgi:nucleotide-binding universal stress UspA family protein
VSYKTVLCCLADDPGNETRLAIAKAVAARFAGELVALHVSPPPILAVGIGEGAACIGPELYEAERAAAAQVTERMKATFRKVCEPITVPAEWRHENGDPGYIAAAIARTADLSVAALEAPIGLDALAPSVAEQLILGAGGPVLLLPQGCTEAPAARRVLVAWNGAREAARAARDALPYLRLAEQVTVVALGESPGRSLGDAGVMLARHGVTVETREEPFEGDAGATLLRLAGELGADLLVLGAYGRARLRELVLGGATREVLRSAKLPVLFSC